MSKLQPPRWSTKLLRFFLRDNFLEEIEGDMEEVFQENLENHSVKKARRIYTREVIKLVRPNLIKRWNGSQKLNTSGMFLYNLEFSFRSLKKSALYSIINLLGLSVAIACCIHLVGFVQEESTYDSFFVDAEQMHRLILERQYPDRKSTSGYVPHSLAQGMSESLPEIESFTTYSGPFRESLISYKNKENQLQSFHENILAVDGNFIPFFGLEMLLGDPKTVLTAPKSMVLTRSAALKHFGDIDIIGQTIKMFRDEFTIMGVLEDLPKNTHLSFEFLMSINTIGRFNATNFLKPDVGCYFKLASGTDIAQLEGKFDSLTDDFATTASRSTSITWDNYKAAGNDFNYSLVPITELYLHPKNLGGMKSGGNKRSNRVMMTVATLIFILACVNFINLNTARTNARVKEISTRKILGSLRRQLIAQLLTETFLISLTSVVIAFLIVILTQNEFNQLSGKDLSLKMNLSTMGYAFSFASILTLLTGIYPAVLLSRIQPIHALRNRSSSQKGGSFIHNGLVVFQFSIAVVLIISMFVMKDQMNFLWSKDLGYEKEQLMVVTGNFHMDPDFVNSFMGELESVPGIEAVAGTLSMPGLGIFWEEEHKLPTSEDLITTQTMKVGDNFSEVMGLRLKAGHFFTKGSWDSLSVILNEAAVLALNLKDNPLGQKIIQVDADGISHNFKVIGVISDFNFSHLYKEVSPLVIKSNEIIYGRSSKVAIRLNGEVDLREMISKVEAHWNELRPTDPFIFKFADEVVDSFYKKEEKLLNVFKAFSSLSILIACLGLFALSANTVSLRIKEIGIRKINGAGETSIIILLGKKITLTVLLACLIATPLTIWGLETWWLSTFAYRVNMNFETIALSCALIISLAWLTIIFHILKAARVNPVQLLRND